MTNATKTLYLIVYIYIYMYIDVSGHTKRGELVRTLYVLYRYCTSRVLVTNVRLAQQSTILSLATRSIACLRINNREEERGSILFLKLKLFFLSLDIGYWWFLIDGFSRRKYAQ